MKTFKLTLFVLFSFSAVFAQENNEKTLELQLSNVLETLEILDNNNQDYNTYQITISALENKKLVANFNLRVEDELTSEDTYKLLNDVAFFDLSLNYKIKKININFNLENLLGYKSSAFDIEPNLVDNNVLFSHEAQFLLSTSIVYNF